MEKMIDACAVLTYYPILILPSHLLTSPNPPPLVRSSTNAPKTETSEHTNIGPHMDELQRHLNCNQRFPSSDTCSTQVNVIPVKSYKPLFLLGRVLYYN